MKQKTILFTGLCALMLMSACGVKPGKLQPPAEAAPSQYPKTYPSSK